ncbi:MAG TPA: hypothetical protein VEZ20_15180 [Allosphingosinicella sp.]|nr:hypothetical protein [Allosphingosinicella sp.]
MVFAKRSAAAAGAGILMLSAAAAAAAQAGAALPVLGRLEPGLWELRNIGGRAQFAPVCLGDPAVLVQLQHRRAGCTRSVVAQGRDRVEVRYACAGAFGQTTIRVEGARLAQVESEGVDNGVPFGFRLEARRVGRCLAPRRR